MKKNKSFSNFISEGGLWDNIRKARAAGKPKKKPGQKGYPKTLDIEGTEGYVSNAQRAAVWANRADGGKGHPDNKKKKLKAHKIPGKTKGPHKEGAMKRISTGDGLDTYKPKPKEIKSAFNARAIVKKDRQGDGKPMSGRAEVEKKYGIKSKLPRQMKDPKKDSMVSKDGKVKVIDKDKEKEHLKKGYVRAEHMVTKELFMKEAKTMMVSHPRTPNRAMQITVDQWPAFKMRGYHHSEQKENRMRTMNLINKMKKASPAAKKALEAPSRVKSPNVTYDKDGNVVKKVEESFITEKAKKGLAAKAEKSGMPQSVLRSVYNRGMAAWKTGHRPGTTPQQWAMARVNSFTTKSSGTWGGADKDLAAKVRKEDVNLDCQCEDCQCNPCECGDWREDMGPQSGGMSTENAENLGEALDMKQRLARGRSARKNKSKLAMGRKKAGRRIASMKVLKKRARRAARKTLTKRLTKGIAKTDLSVSRKREIEKRLDKPAFKIKANRLVKRTIKDIRKKEIARKRK